jgi:hypothetical protein
VQRVKSNMRSTPASQSLQRGARTFLRLKLTKMTAQEFNVQLRAYIISPRTTLQRRLQCVPTMQAFNPQTAIVSPHDRSHPQISNAAIVRCGANTEHVNDVVLL